MSVANRLAPAVWEIGSRRTPDTRSSHDSAASDRWASRDSEPGRAGILSTHQPR